MTIAVSSGPVKNAVARTPVAGKPRTGVEPAKYMYYLLAPYAGEDLLHP